ncbi:Transmembrane 9 superfamily member 1 [Capsicum annuum]|nr:Transmembrane 9 superfamily member 1 [Capsicum annuum]
MHTLRNDYAKYACENDDVETAVKDVIEESGWKLVHDNVFRPPQNLALLSAVVGTGENCAKSMVLTASLFPFLCFGIGFILNNIAIFYGSIARIPLGTVVVVFVIWAFISLPLSLLGTVVGRNWSGMPNNPCRVINIPRPIPEKKRYLRPSVNSLVRGLLPFASIFTEIYFVFSSLWKYMTSIYVGYTLMFCIGVGILCGKLS